MLCVCANRRHTRTSCVLLLTWKGKIGNSTKICGSKLSLGLREKEATVSKHLIEPCTSGVRQFYPNRAHPLYGTQASS